ncbi:peptidoglycan-binding protein [Streptomyces sp. NPDC002888]|uniref:peptidoglycan-binding domain-containing protein n=1 Tax=Streptomyces sp. NPDC002888 TaxID=3364668 RepID=UPI0036872C3E
MDESNGHQCPQCGALRARDNTPSCACTQRASEALRDARTAEAAAAEDFDPLRIRPYVEIEGEAARKGPEEGQGQVEGQGPAEGQGREDGQGREERQAPPAPDATMPLRAVAAEQHGPAEATAALPTPLAPPAGAPSAMDLSLFESAPGAPVAEEVSYVSDAAGASGNPYVEADDRPRRHRRTVLLGATAAVVAVVAAAGFASGLFSYETPSRDGSASKDVRAAVPAPSTSAASTPPTSAPPKASPTPTPTTTPSSASPTASPSRSASSAPPSASPSTEPAPTTPAADATTPLKPEDNASRQSAPDSDSDADNVALRHGDRGAEVTELQQRLGQLFLYNDDIDGKYSTQVEDAVRNYQWSRGIQDDELGVYGPTTRKALESETKEP